MKLVLMKEYYGLREKYDYRTFSTFDYYCKGKDADYEFYKTHYKKYNRNPYYEVYYNERFIVDRKKIKTYNLNFNFNFNDLENIEFEEKEIYKFDYNRNAIDKDGNICLYTYEHKQDADIKITEEQKNENANKTNKDNEEWLKKMKVMDKKSKISEEKIDIKKTKKKSFNFINWILGE